MKQGKVLKIMLAIVATIVLANIVYFAYNANVWLGVGASIVAVIIGAWLINFVKKPLSKDGRFW